MSFDLSAIVRRHVSTAASTRNAFAAALIALFALGLSSATSAGVVSETGGIPPAASASMSPGFAPAHFQDTVTVMVELADKPAAQVYADALKVAVDHAGGNFAGMSKATQDALKSAAASQSKAQVARIEAAQQAILPRLTALSYNGKIVFRTKSAYNGVSMHVARAQLPALAKVPGVKAVHIQIPKFLTAATDIDFLNVRTAWVKTTANAPYGAHGDNIKVADIDTGLDYIHTNFGGPGTPAAYTGVTDTGPVPNPYFPTFKIPGGFDFAGDAYDANQPPGTGHDAVPDANPMDSNGHGTGTASLIAGLGVTSGGGTFIGTYDNATDIASLRISPGMAPRALLYPLRVFGTTGSTNLVTQAIDWAVDPNGDGNIADHMDVINMSLGSNTGSADDADSAAASNAAAVGIIVASAAGNAGDSYYIVSSPSVGGGTLSVAATFNNTGGYFFNANVTANSPPAVAGQKYNSIYGSPSPAVPPAGFTGNIVYANPPDASGPLTNAAQISGNIAMIDRGVVSFVAKVQAAQAAGAVAVIIVQSAGGSGTPNPIVMALDNTTNIPAMMIGLNEGNTIKANLDLSPGGTRSGVNVTLNNDNGFVNIPTTAADTMPTYSSRGPRLGDAMLKPDVSAPAEVVGVAAALTGNQVESFNGTSSATPHVAGVMAILRQLHPTWSVEELMALAMNTATHDEFVGPSTGGGAQYGVGRVGAGRIDVATASTANVVAFNQTDPGLVNVSFGIVEVPVAGSVTLSKTVVIKNNGAAPVTYNLSYQDVTPVNGATFTVGSGVPITISGNSTATFTVQFDATGSALKHIREAAVTLQLPAGTSRQWLTEKTGYAVLTPTGGPEPTLRVALYASPKPISSMGAGTLTPGAPGQFTLTLTGNEVNTGPTTPTDIVSLVKPFELQFMRPALPPPPIDANVIKTVGVTSDFLERGANPQNTVITFLLEGIGNASTPDFFSSDKEIDFSLDGGNTFAYALFLTSAANGTANSNAYFPEIVNLNTGGALLRFRTNGFNPNTLDTNAYNNNVVTIPVLATDIGLAGPAMPTSFMYEVFTFDRGGAQIDDTGLLTYNLAAPGVDAQGGNLDPFFYTDLTTTTIPIAFNGANLLANGSKGMLLAHMHNGAGLHTEVVTFAPPALQSAVSRKVHGAAGTFDLPLSLVVPPAINHNPTTEPRQGPGQTIVFTFDKPISGAIVTVSEGTATASPPTFSGNDVIVSLTGVTDIQYVTVDLSSVSSTDGGSGGTASARVGFLAGDVNQTRVVSLADVALVNFVLAQTVTAANYLKDVNGSGTLTIADKAIAAFNLTHTLGTP